MHVNAPLFFLYAHNALGDKLDELRSRVSQAPSEKPQAPLEAKEVKEEGKDLQATLLCMAQELHFSAEDYAAFVKAIAKPGNPYRENLWKLMERFRLNVDLL